mmetsp:Transcript_12138/g.26799  ORF Transcript_12138/g.26799 Transcript_12138/m.26799 type:complete len:238 (+) Transcript_12138:1691-2404(+)
MRQPKRSADFRCPSHPRNSDGQERNEPSSGFRIVMVGRSSHTSLHFLFVRCELLATLLHRGLLLIRDLLMFFLFLLFRIFCCYCGALICFRNIDSSSEIHPIGHKIAVAPLVLNAPAFKNNYLVAARQQMNVVGHQDSSHVLAHWPINSVGEDVFTHVCIHSGERIVHQHNLCVSRVKSSSQTNPCLLTTRQVDSAFSDFCHVSSGKNCNIINKRAGFNHFVVTLLIELTSEKNVAL